MELLYTHKIKTKNDDAISDDDSAAEDQINPDDTSAISDDSQMELFACEGIIPPEESHLAE